MSSSFLQYFLFLNNWYWICKCWSPRFDYAARAWLQELIHELENIYSGTPSPSTYRRKRSIVIQPLIKVYSADYLWLHTTYMVMFTPSYRPLSFLSCYKGCIKGAETMGLESKGEPWRRLVPHNPHMVMFDVNGIKNSSFSLASTNLFGKECIRKPSKWVTQHAWYVLLFHSVYPQQRNYKGKKKKAKRKTYSMQLLTIHEISLWSHSRVKCQGS